MNPKFHNINPIEGMMINIREEGKKDIWGWIESMSDPYKRVRYRSVYFEALRRLKKC